MSRVGLYGRADQDTLAAVRRIERKVSTLMVAQGLVPSATSAELLCYDPDRRLLDLRLFSASFGDVLAALRVHGPGEYGVAVDGRRACTVSIEEDPVEGERQ